MKTVCILRSSLVNPDLRVEKEAATFKKNGYNVIIAVGSRVKLFASKKHLEFIRSKNINCRLRKV